MNKLLIVIIVILPFILLGCSSVKSTDVLNSLLSTSSYDKQEINYSNIARQGIDIYNPKKGAKKTPIVFIYGGAWRDGSKKDFEFVAHALVSLGHPVIIPDYRLYPQVTFPSFIDDIAKSIHHIEVNANRYLQKPFNEYILMGHSAGAHTAALLATDRQYLRKYNIKAKLMGLIAMAGPYDLPLDDPEVIPVFGDVNEKVSNPIMNIHKDLPPVLLIHGASDIRVLPKHTIKFDRALRNAGLSVTTQLYPKVNHTQLIGSLAVSLRFLNDSYKDIAAFLVKQKL